MDKGWMHPALAASLLGFVIAPQAEARDHDVAAGIQYVIQGSKEDRRTLEDTRRIFEKAVMNLKEGMTRDPKDGEAWIYLGIAYGELDSLEQAGTTFAEAIRRVADTRKLLKRATDYRDYYFNTTYNHGVQLYNHAMTMLPAEPIANSTSLTAAGAQLALAEAQLRNALALNPEKAIAYDKLAAILAVQGKLDEAGLVVDHGLVNSRPKEGEEYERLVKRKAR